MVSEPSSPLPLPRVALGKNLARSVRAGHPWIFRDALRPAAGPAAGPAHPARPALANGSLVLLTTGDGRPLGRGFWTATTPLALRMLTTDPRDDIAALVRARFAAALERRLAFIDLARTNAFRWVHGEADLLPGVHLDVYGTIGAVRFDGPGARAFYRDIAPTVLAAGARLGLSALVERRRSARAGASQDAGAAPGTDSPQGKRKRPAPRLPARPARPDDVPPVLAGALPPDELEVRENDLRFAVDLVRGQKGGLFLDQRENRARVGAEARDRRLLNLFGYTGGFSIYGAAGGARATTTVDVAAGAIAAARGNFLRNGLPLDRAELIAGDVFRFLGDAAVGRRRWELVISDPPSFAPNRQALPEALRAYRRLHRLCAAVVEPGGLLYAASCSSHVDEAAFVKSVDAGCADAGRRFHLREVHGAGRDHPVIAAFPEGRYLKLAIGTVT